jgi:hypothetical protein
MIILGKVRPLSRHLAEAHPQVLIIAPLERFIRCRDLTCRFPGCDRPAELCDIDHTVPYPLGLTHPSNLKCVCRKQHRFSEILSITHLAAD